MKTWMAPGKGLVTKPLPKTSRGCKRIASATRKQQRGCLSHVAFVCDRPEIQPRLPHVLIGNRSVLPAYVQREVEPQLMRNVFLVRRKSAWVDANYMVKIIELLGTILAPDLNRFQPILLMDALPAHTAPKVFRAAARFRIWVVIVPAKLTWLIQPADTHVFYKYKMYLKKRYAEAVACSQEGALNLREVLLAMNAGVRYVCQARDWSYAFDDNGFGKQQQLLRTSIADAAGFELPLSMPAAIPNLWQLRSIWPAGSDVPLDAVFAPILSSPRHRQPSSAAQPAPAPIPAEAPWRERLRPRRSSSFLSAPAPAEDAAPSLHDTFSGAGQEACPARGAATEAAAANRARSRRPAPQPIAASRPSARSF